MEQMNHEHDVGALDLASIIDALELPTAVTDSTGSIRLVNEAARSILGERTGGNLLDLIEGARHPGGAVDLDSLARGQTLRSARFALRRSPEQAPHDQPAVSVRLSTLGGEHDSRKSILVVFEPGPPEHDVPTEGELRRLAAVGAAASHLGHQINNSLASIKNVGSVLRTTLPDDNPDLRFLEMLNGEVDRAARAVRQFLDARCPEEAFAEPFPIATSIADAVSQVRSEAAEAGVSISAEPTWGGNTSLCIAHGLLREILYHLLQEIIASSDPGNIVSIATRLDSRDLVISIDSSPAKPSSTFKPVQDSAKQASQAVRSRDLWAWIPNLLIAGTGGRIVREATGAGEPRTEIRIPVVRMDRDETNDEPRRIRDSA